MTTLIKTGYFCCTFIILCVLKVHPMPSNESSLVAKPSELDAQALFLVSSEDGKIRAIEANDWVLDIKKVCQFNDIDSQLTQLGLVANGESRSLVLHYNQKIAIDDIEDALGCYWFPHVVANSEINKLLDNGFLLRVSAFSSEKKQLWEATDSLYETLDIDANSIAILTAETLFEPMLTLVKNHNALMSTIDSNNVIMPLEVIEQALAEIELLRSLITRPNNDSGSATQQEEIQINHAKLSIQLENLALINNIAQSVNSRASAYQEVFGNFVKSINRTKVPLTVSLLDPQGNEQSNYEVWFAPKPLLEVARFHRSIGLTSPATGSIRAGNYIFWAVQHTAQGKEVVSNYRELPIDDLAKLDTALNLLFIKE